MTLKTKPRNTATPYVLDIYDADKPEGTDRVVARYDTRSGKIWRTHGVAARHASMGAIKAAVEAAS
jgi:hypothetical protein